MKTLMLFLLLACFTNIANSASLQPTDVSTLESSGLPLYPGVAFCVGTATSGMRLASSDNPEVVRKWYIQKLPEWSIYQKFNIWVLYDGPAGVGFSEVMRYNQVNILENKDLPSWHSLAANMTTEILITIPRVTKAASGKPLLTIPAQPTSLDQSLISEISSIEIVGQMDSYENPENNKGLYYNIRDENYNEYIIAYESDLPRDLRNNLYSIGPTYDKVKVKGDIIKLKDGTILGFDRNKRIEIFPVE